MNIASIFSLIRNLDLLAIGVAIAAIGILGFMVYFNNKESITNKTFFYFTIAAISWGTVNYLNYQFASEVLILWLLRFVIFFAVWYSFFLWQFFYVFPNEKMVFPKWYKLFLIPLVVITSLTNLTPIVFSGIAELAPVGQVSKVNIAPGMILFVIVVLGLILSAIYLLIRKIWKIDIIQRKQYRLIAFGAFFTFLLHIIFNLILPAFFVNVRFIPLGAVFTFPFVVFTAYAIVRHKLFNIRVAGAATLVFILSIVSFFEVLLSDSLALIIYRTIVLIVILIFGILLIRGVIREVKQKEQIAQMAADIRRAYEIEKKAEEDTKRALILEQKAKKELEELDKVKNQFLAQTQHDLRRPLGLIRNLADMMAKGMFGKQTKKSLEALEKIETISESKIKEVNTFLDTAQFQLGKKVVNLSPNVDLSSILKEIVNELTPEAEGRKIYLKLEEPNSPLLITADREKLKSSVYNIVDNSIKFTATGGVTVKAEIGEKVKVSVIDTGAGINKEILGKLFKETIDPLKHHESGYGGKGMGLFLANKVIEAHNGKIWAESEGDGRGASFIIELPIESSIDKQPQTDKN